MCINYTSIHYERCYVQLHQVQCWRLVEHTDDKILLFPSFTIGNNIFSAFSKERAVVVFHAALSQFTYPTHAYWAPPVCQAFRSVLGTHRQADNLHKVPAVHWGRRQRQMQTMMTTSEMETMYRMSAKGICVVGNGFLEPVTPKLLSEEWVLVNPNAAYCHPRNAPFR